jgi:hypothetical protein
MSNSSGKGTAERIAFRVCSDVGFITSWPPMLTAALRSICDAVMMLS